MYSVPVPPEIIEDWTGSTIKVLEGATVELVCNATGVPIPVVTWFRQADSLMDYTSTDYGEIRYIGTVDCNRSKFHGNTLVLWRKDSGHVDS